MGQLARYLQDQFIARTPKGWSCEVEARVLDERFEKLPGYAPQADVLLASNDGRFRLWNEFEVSAMNNQFELEILRGQFDHLIQLDSEGSSPHGVRQVAVPNTRCQSQR